MRDNELDPVKEKLGINNWRELSKNHVLALLEQVPELSAEALKRLVELAPYMKEVAKESLDKVQSSFDTTVNANTESSNRVHAAIEDARKFVEGQLAEGDLSPKERLLLNEQYERYVQMHVEHDAENKKFLDANMAKAIVAIGGIALGIFVIGAKAVGGSNSLK
jgi:hypothetical protein